MPDLYVLLFLKKEKKKEKGLKDDRKDEVARPICTLQCPVLFKFNYSPTLSSNSFDANLFGLSYEFGDKDHHPLLNL